MKHKHYDMIVAKAANMDLVVFVKDGNDWRELTQETPFYEDNSYFLCLPQHKGACLHWLNGEKSQVEYTKASYPYWCDIDSDESNWSYGHIFMDELLNIRIKPKKEKRWIVWDTAQKIPENYSFSSLGEARSEFDYPDAQFIEIEVEV